MLPSPSDWCSLFLVSWGAPIGSNPGSGKFFADLFYLSKRDRVQNSPTVGVTCRFFVYDQSKTVSFIINASQDESQTQWVEGDGNMQFVGNSLTD
ncbi:Uncharacterized protein TCM_028755 [Theobroma cacao]|uniref:Uncharacterized protein n=1 Tax=Theobroma cacao TaxID=3641 RepID=A0A061GCC7_THECC|nr:Uncharacterized protein TCM_028755 [Theobroma cacao]